MQPPTLSGVPACFTAVRTACLAAALAVFNSPAGASPGASVPWTTYEAEAMTVSGGVVLGPQYAPNVVASESSGRRCVQLTATGQYVQFTAQSSATALVVRYSVPDTANGSGTNYTLSLYTNGIFAEKLQLTSRFSWLYGSYPFTNRPSAGSPRNFYDEVRTNNLFIEPGDVLRLQKDGTDTAASYTIDLADLEAVPPALTQPGNSLSVLSYGATGNGVSDDTAALNNCISAAVSQAKSVWLPPGNYRITASVNLPSNLTMQGAGMWYATLTGDPVLYTNSSRRVALNGNGNNIHLSDFAIVGKLNYRNDSEPNDGLTGAYGTGSTLARIWVEHTKTGAWLVNSSGLVVDSCRFRDTVADGINLAVGMQGTVVTNCTARGTGDDCFPIWPAVYTAQAYAPGNNVITHCTGQTPFLANGAAIYGAAGNRIEDSQFIDISYGCGVLLSTTFPVGTNRFSGTTTVQRCDLIRSGGFDPGYQWRAALQLCLDTYANGISGVNLNHLNITNSISDGLSIIGNSGTLSSATAGNVSIPNFGLGISGRNALWARNDAMGSLVVSNSNIIEYRNDSSRFTFTFVTNTVAAPVQSLAFPQPPSNVIQGAVMAPEVDVAAFGTGGEPLADAAISIALGSGTGNLQGTLTRLTDAVGIAHFNDLSFDQPGPKTLTATALNGLAAPTNSGSFLVIGTVAGLAFATQPGFAVAGVPFVRQPVLETVDSLGTPTTAGLPSDLFVTIQLTNGTGLSGTVSNYNIGTSGYNGTIAFNGLSIGVPGNAEQLVASFVSESPVPGAVIHLDASAPGTLAGGLRVQTWNSEGAAGQLWFTQTNAALQPWLTNQLNGKPVVTFSKNGNGYGTGCTFLGYIGQGTAINTGSQMTYFIVARQSENAFGWQAPVSFSGAGQIDGQGTDGVVVLADGSQSAPFPLGIQRNHPGTPMQADVAVPPVGVPFELTFVDNAGAAALYLTDATGLARNNNASIINGIIPYRYAITDAAIGGRLEPDPSVVDNGWDGDVAEVIVYDVALSDSDRMAVEAYLTNKWFVVNGTLAGASSEPFSVQPAWPPSQAILQARAGAGSLLTITYATTPGYSYHLETATNLAPAVWTDLPGSTTNAAGTTVTFSDTNLISDQPRFYRSVSP